MATTIALYRFWPDVAAQLDERLAAWAERERTTSARLGGTFDLAVAFEADGDWGERGSRALEIAWSMVQPSPLAPLPTRRERGDDMGAASGEDDPFADVPPDVGIQLLRARDGWNLMACRTKETWLTISMTFLRKRLYHRFDEWTAWRSGDVNELATLVLGTHRAEDIEGTSQTYGVPCLSLRDWADERQAAGGSLEAAPSSLLASSLQYGALVTFDGPLPADGAGAGPMLRRLVAIGGADIIPR